MDNLFNFSPIILQPISFMIIAKVGLQSLISRYIVSDILSDTIVTIKPWLKDQKVQICWPSNEIWFSHSVEKFNHIENFREF